MIRRSTWITFGIFILVVLMAIFLTRSPSSPLGKEQTTTPAATSTPPLFGEVTSASVTAVRLERLEGLTSDLVKQSDGSWVLQPGNVPVTAGQMEQLLSELFATRILTTLDENYDLSTLGLANPTFRLTIQLNGEDRILSIGALTPTGNGYYVKFLEGPSMVVSKYAVEAAVAQMDLLLPTPTPEVMQPPAATPTP
ncbi:MAG: DUF4340 domain-containing protein [Anaerolineae bacterium]|nr:DUF4340 domain-containing protein [Anaerolineae bacterium]